MPSPTDALAPSPVVFTTVAEVRLASWIDVGPKRCTDGNLDEDDASAAAGWKLMLSSALVRRLADWCGYENWKRSPISVAGCTWRPLPQVPWATATTSSDTRLLRAL